MQRVLVTGATGFVGRALVGELARRRAYDVYAASRSPVANPLAGVRYFSVDCLDPATRWKASLDGVNTLIHTAARVHVLSDRAAESLVEFQRVNVDATLRLATYAAELGVQRFVFLSSIGVNGVQTAPNTAFSEIDAPNPHNAYARSKLDAERALQRVAKDSGMEVVIVRPPLVYGPGVKANFAALMQAILKGWPLPLGGIDNRRSLIALDNLVDFILTSMVHPLAANQTFLVSDGFDISTCDLVRGLAKAADVSTWVPAIPLQLLRVAAMLLRRSHDMQRLCGNLQVDITKAKTLLNWAPPITVADGLRRAVGGSPITGLDRAHTSSQDDIQ